MGKATNSTDLGLTLNQGGSFVDLFYPSVDVPVNARTGFNLSVLRIENGDFILDQLFDVLANTSLTYVLSRTEYRKFLADSQRVTLWLEEAKAKFQEPNATNGEGGEIILYAMLEGFTGAPKLLSKMEIKTNNKMPVFGSDGVHLLKVTDGEYQLIFGESKMYGDLGEAIRNAFESMSDVKQKAFRNDTSLVSSQLMKEAIDDEQLDALEAILTPAAGAPRAVKLYKSFGVLLTFDLDVTDFDLAEHSDDQIEAEFLQRAKAEVVAKTVTIKKQIEKYQLGATHFHIFAVPFLRKKVGNGTHGVDKVRTDLQFRLRWGKS